MLYAPAGQWTNSIASATSLVVTTASNAGRCLVLWLTSGTGTTRTFGVTDSAGNIWTQIASKGIAAQNARVECWIAPNAAATTSVTVTVTSGTATSIGANVTAWAGLLTASPVDTSTTTDNGAVISTSVASGSLTPTQVGDLILVGLSYSGTSNTATLSGTPTPVWASYTALTPVAITSGVNQTNLAVAYLQPAALDDTAYQAHWTLGSAAYAAGAVVALKTPEVAVTDIRGSVVGTTGGALALAGLAGSIPNIAGSVTITSR